MDHTQFTGGQPVELSEAELAVVHGGSLFSWIKNKVIKPLIHAITHRNEPEPGQPFGKDPTYHPDIYQYETNRHGL